MGYGNACSDPVISIVFARGENISGHRRKFACVFVYTVNKENGVIFNN